MWNGKISRLSITAAGFALMLAFHNCSPLDVAPNGAATDKSIGSVTTLNNQANGSGTGNGQGYDGKATTFVTQLKNSLCTDGSNIKDSISVYADSNKAVQTRKDCSNIAPVTIDPSSLVSTPRNRNFLIYGSNAYQSSTSVDPNNVVFYICATSNSMANPVTVSIGVKAMSGTFFGQFATNSMDSGVFDVQMIPVMTGISYSGSDSLGDRFSMTDGLSQSVSITFSSVNSATNANINSAPLTCYQHSF